MKVVFVLAVGASAADLSWEQYKQQFGKVYDSAENGVEEKRRAIYEAKMTSNAAHNAVSTTYKRGVNTFSDLTAEEFIALPIRGFIASEDTGLPNLGSIVAGDATPVGSVNWVELGATTPVKNQGQCGSCWAFSTTGGVEGAWEVATANLVSVSEQQLVDCSKASNGCQGGSMNSAFTFESGVDVAEEDSYPYTATDTATCKTVGYTTAIPAGGVTGYKKVGGFFGAKAKDLMLALDKGPVSVAIEADQKIFQDYTSGIIASTDGCGTSLDHGVLAVAYDSESYTVKNSWGPSWGDAGFVKFSTAGNVCGILKQGSSPTVDAGVLSVAV